MKAHTSDRALEIGGTFFKDVGSVAQLAVVGELTLTHLVPTVGWTAEDGWVEISDDEWLDGPRSEFMGAVYLARELDVLTLPRRA